MAIYNEILEGGLNESLARRLAMQTSAPAPALQPEIVPAIILENDRPEMGALRDEFRYSAQGVLAAPGAGLHNFLSIQPGVNGAGLGVVESIITDTQCYVTLGSNIVGTARNTSRRDFRGPLQSGFVTLTGSVLTAAIPTTIAYRTFASVRDETVWVFGGRLIQNGLYLITANANDALTFSVAWRERPVNSNELG